MNVRPNDICRVVRCDALPTNVGRVGLVLRAGAAGSRDMTPDGFEHVGGRPGNRYWVIEGAFEMLSNVGVINTHFAIFDERCLRRIDPADEPDEMTRIIAVPEQVTA